MATPKLRFKEFDGDWDGLKIKDLVKSLDAGVSVNSEDIQPESDQYSVLKTSCISSGYFEEGERKRVLLKVEIERLKERVLDDSILMSRMNTPLLVGRNAYVLKAPAKTFLPDRLWQLKVNKDRAVTRWLAFYLGSDQGLNQIRDLASGTSGSMKNITKPDVMNLNLFAPSKEEQTKIASFLSAVDEKISQLTQKHELLSQYKQGMMQKLFSQQIRFKADDCSEFGEWEDIQLKDFLNLTLRPISKPESNYHALGVRSHFKGLFNKYDSEPEKISMDTLYRVEKDDVVVNITFAWEGAMAIAQSEHDQGLVSHRFPTYRCDDNLVNLWFFKYRFVQKDFLSHLQLCSPGGAGRNRVLNKKAFLEITFSKPCLEEQIKIANFLSAIDQKIEKVAKQVEETKQWKQGLLQQMFV
ncbi:hypothetical protein FJU73_14640 [Acinetobacter baumannii]|nr:restriction endonuclease subunit S [Acinetobacter baumannii]TPT12595.1 hypothetical protein FJU73_14640 [Acinetobacter baumannii]